MKPIGSKIYPRLSPKELEIFKVPKRVNTIFPAKPIKPLKSKMITYSLATLLLNILALAISVHENSLLGQNDLEINETQLYERMAVNVLSCLQGIVNLNYWILHVKIDKAYNKEYIKNNLIKGNSNKRQVIFELITTFFIYPWNYNKVIYQDESFFISLDDVVTLLNLLRVYYIYKFVYDYSDYNSIRAHWVTNFAGVSNLMIFNLKSQMQSKMFRFIILNLILSILIFSFAIDIVEKNFSQTAISISDSAFLIIVTETTVGFGDILPHNFISRFICVVASLFGTALIALLVIAVQQIADLNETEVNIYNTILLKKESRTLSNLAAKIIQTFWRLTQKRRKKEQRFFIVIKLYKLLKDFRIKYTRIRSKYYVGLKKNIQMVERQSKLLIKGLSRELNSADSYSSISLKMVVNQCEISEKTSAIKSNYRRMFHMLSEDKNIENSARMLSSSRNSDNNTLALFKKRRDKAMKKLLMRYSNSPSSNSSMLSPHN